MTATTSLKLELLQKALLSFEKEHGHLTETWRAIDRKAQVATAISGIFLATSFAWAKELLMSFSSLQRYSMSVMFIMLVVSVVLALGGMQVRKVPSSPAGTDSINLTLALIKNLHDRRNDKSLMNYYADQIAVWQKRNIELRNRSLSKALWIKMSQIALVAAASVATINTLYSILK